MRKAAPRQLHVTESENLVGLLKEQMEERCWGLSSRLSDSGAACMESAMPGQEELAAFSKRAETLQAELQASQSMEARLLPLQVRTSAWQKKTSLARPSCGWRLATKGLRPWPRQGLSRKQRSGPRGARPGTGGPGGHWHRTAAGPVRAQAELLDSARDELRVAEGAAAARRAAFREAERLRLQGLRSSGPMEVATDGQGKAKREDSGLPACILVEPCLNRVAALKGAWSRVPLRQELAAGTIQDQWWPRGKEWPRERG